MNEIKDINDNINQNKQTAIYHKLTQMLSRKGDYSQDLRHLKDLCPVTTSNYLLDIFGTVDSEKISNSNLAGNMILLLLSHILNDLESSVPVDDYINKIIDERNV